MIGELRGVKEVTGRDGKRYGLWTIEISQDRGNWNSKADFSETDRDGVETQMGAMHRSGALERLQGRRVAVRVIGAPSRRQPEGWPGDKSLSGYVNYRAVSLLALDEGSSALSVVQAV